MPIIEVVQRIEVPDIPDIDLPYEDGEPLESNWHRLQINLLGDMLHQHWPEHTDYFAGGNMFVYYSLYSLEQARTRDYKGPDFFVVLGVDGARAEAERARAEAEQARVEALEAENTRLRADPSSRLLFADARFG